MGQNLPLCAQLGAARSRQDESKGVYEVGSKRPSSGGNGGGFDFAHSPPCDHKVPRFGFWRRGLSFFLVAG
jgi:hypothetical protein